MSSPVKALYPLLKQANSDAPQRSDRYTFKDLFLQLVCGQGMHTSELVQCWLIEMFLPAEVDQRRDHRALVDLINNSLLL